MADRFVRPPTPDGFDPSRAADRAGDPAGWRYDAARREAVHDVIRERRDVRRFRSDVVPASVLDRILTAAHAAPSVGLMQPWRFVVITSERTRSAIRALAQRERVLQAERFPGREAHFLDQKVEGVLEAPVGICVCCDHGPDGEHILGRGTIPQTDVYSTACAIENLWLAARAEGVGVGWVSFYRPAELSGLLGLPETVEPIAYLCLGWPDERPIRPTLETVGWSRRLALADVVMRERWRVDGDVVVGDRWTPDGRSHPGTSLDHTAASSARDRFDELITPAGGLGALEPAVERWALVTGAPPPERITAGVLIAAADHGHTRHGTSLYSDAVSAQIVAAAARGESAVGVSCAVAGHPLLIIDVGLAGPTPAGVRDRRIAAATGDITRGPAMSSVQLARALGAGADGVGELADQGVDCVVLGEIGIGNTTTAAALVAGLTGITPGRLVGRGTGVDADGIVRKQTVVAQALEVNGLFGDGPYAPRDVLARVGGFELAALTGAILAASRAGLPVVLDGFAVGAAALCATRIDPLCGEGLIAGHRSAEPGHRIVLAELGLEPLLDLRLRLGEASGALLALPLLERAASLHRRMGTFAEAGIDRAS